jgi:hypothetical protein
MKTMTIMPCRSRMDSEERRALALAEVLGLIATKATPGARDIVPNACVEVAKRFPAGTDFRKDLTSRAEARQLVEQLQRAKKS